MRSDVVILARHAAGFILIERIDCAANGWHDMRLIAETERPRKSKWWLAWSETECRLSRRHDTAVLQEYLPEIYSWVEACCRHAYGRAKVRA
jgi:hypothetical protein